MAIHVTPTGRAIGKGKTRRVLQGMRTVHRGQEKPLPVWLQCHPQALVATPLHPDCKRIQSWGGAFLKYRGKRAVSYEAGAGLQESGRFTLYVQGEPVGYVNDPQDGLGWIRAAAERDVIALMYETEN